MSTHNICFPGEIRKILCGYPLLSVAMTCVIYNAFFFFFFFFFFSAWSTISRCNVLPSSKNTDGKIYFFFVTYHNMHSWIFLQNAGPRCSKNP